MLFYSIFNQKEVQNKIRKSEQEDSVDKKTETKLKLMNKLKKLKPCLGGAQTFCQV